MRYEGFYLYSLEPLILGRMGQLPATFPQWAVQAARRSSKPPIVIEHPAWFSGYWLKLLRKKQEAKRLRSIGWRYQLFRNDPLEHQRCRWLGLEGVFASHNVFVDESIYRPLAITRNYDAVYVAKAERFKRHELACEVKRLHFLMPSPVDPATLDSRLRHATVNSKDMSKEDIVRTLNQAACTLALSREEGGMYACVESLLCGVPVVSTKSRGGRAIFLNSNNSITVETDTPHAIAQAVQTLIEAPLDPTLIRAQVLKELNVHRERMVNHLSIEVSGTREKAAEFYRRLFTKSDRVERIGDEIFVPDSALEIPPSVLRLG